MKRILILTAVGMLLGGMAGCRFMECLWRGGPCQQNNAPAATCPTACPPAAVCDPCPCSGATTVVTPGPETYAPAR